MGTIFISAGHYLNEPGASSFAKTTEAQEMMQTRDLIVQELKSMGLKDGQDFVTVPDDLDLSPTINWINSRATSGDIALEIHGNAFDGSVRGTECFYLDGNDERKGNAELILNSLLQQVPELTNRGVKPDTLTHVGKLAFCRQVTIPSLLL
ncbi:N-acetylmuramoyl-L-alanine amidase family protein [Capilliphycus salinus ALCB114379]|uniref:N-acetylmuramoyl-L-alanine amidase family protein n=1 Tax=Capilliphycus salinus TaxID=2768948 RepID=UPI0039A5E28F